MSTPPETPDSFTLQPKSKSLFAESPLLSFNPRSTGPGGDDMSLSELSLGSDATPHRFLPPSRVAEPAQPPRFSLFGPSQSPQAVRTQDEVDEDDDADQSYIVEQSDVGHESAPATPRAEDRRHTQEEDSMNGEAAADASGVEATLNAGAPKRAAPDPRQREEELRSTLFQLQSLNTVLREYMETLHDTEANNRTLLQQVENSHLLLNQYTSVLSQTEHTTKLLLNRQWEGAEADETRAAEEAEREERERERLEQEAREKVARLERERIQKEAEAERLLEEKERKAKATEPRGRGRGRVVRGAPVVRGATPPAVRGRGTNGTTTGLRRPTVLRGGTRARGRAA